MMSIEFANDEWLEIFKDFLRASQDRNYPAALKRIDAAAEFADKNGLYLLFVETLIAKSDTLQIIGDLDEAEKTAERAVSLSLEHWETERVTHAHALCALARVTMAKGNLLLSMNLFEDAIKIFKRNKPACNFDVIPHFFALFLLYIEQGLLSQADKVSRYTLDLTRDLVGEKDYAVVWALACCSQAAVGLGKPRRVANIGYEIWALLNGEPLSDELAMAEMVHAALDEIQLPPDPDVVETPLLPSLRNSAEPNVARRPARTKRMTLKNNVFDIRTGKIVKDNAKGKASVPRKKPPTESP